MNEDLEYLEELEKDLDRVIRNLTPYLAEVIKLKNLNYTPNTIAMLRPLKMIIEADHIEKLRLTVKRGYHRRLTSKTK